MAQIDDNINDLTLFLSDMETETGNQSIVWNGTAYVATPSIQTNIITPEPGSILHTNKTLTVLIRQSLFNGILPTQGNLISYKGTNWEIQSIDNDPFAVYLQLHCIESRHFDNKDWQILQTISKYETDSESADLKCPVTLIEVRERTSSRGSQT